MKLLIEKKKTEIFQGNHDSWFIGIKVIKVELDTMRRRFMYSYSRAKDIGS